jgi:hypothetical protein
MWRRRVIPGGVLLPGQHPIQMVLLLRQLLLLPFHQQPARHACTSQPLR